MTVANATVETLMYTSLWNKPVLRARQQRLKQLFNTEVNVKQGMSSMKTAEKDGCFHHLRNLYMIFCLQTLILPALRALQKRYANQGSEGATQVFMYRDAFVDDSEG